MNILEDDNKPGETIWVGTAYVIPAEHSPLEKAGFIGGYAFVAFRSENIAFGVSALCDEFRMGDTVVVGFEWLSRLEDNERTLLEGDYELIGSTANYPVQFRDVHWFEHG